MAGNDRCVNTNHIQYLPIDRISNMLGLHDKDMYNEANVDTFINSKLNALDHNKFLDFIFYLKPCFIFLVNKN